MRVRVQDRVGRSPTEIGWKVAALPGGEEARIGRRFEVQRPQRVGDGVSTHDSVLLVLGTILGRLAECAGMEGMDAGAPGFVGDVRGALCRVFCSIRVEADSRGAREVLPQFEDASACRQLLQTLVSRVSPGEVSRPLAGARGAGSSCRAQRGGEQLLGPDLYLAELRLQT